MRMINEQDVLDIIEDLRDRMTVVGYWSAIERVKALPSAQPDLSGYSDKLWKRAYERGRAEARSEIVRCKDCKHFKRNIPCVGGFYDGCDELIDDGNEMFVDENFYCGYAERRADE